MTILIETTDVSVAYEQLSSIFGVRQFSAPSGHPYVRIEQDQLGPAGLHHLTFTMECDIDGALMGAYFFGLISSGTVRYHRDGGGWESPRYGPGDVFLAVQPDILWHGDHVSTDLEFASLDAALLAQVADTAPGRRPRPIRFTGYQPATSSDARLWESTFRWVRGQIGATASAAEPLVAGTAGRLLAAAALTVFPNDALTDPTIEDRHDAHTDTLRRAVAFIDENAHRDITIADIAAAAFVTVRAIQLAFRRHLDITPMGYLRQVRLDHAHRDLLTADPAHHSVATIAYRWGFPTPARFSAYYRDAYGVAPTHTLRQDLAGSRRELSRLAPAPPGLPGGCPDRARHVSARRARKAIPAFAEISSAFQATGLRGLNDRRLRLLPGRVQAGPGHGRAGGGGGPARPGWVRLAGYVRADAG